MQKFLFVLGIFALIDPKGDDCPRKKTISKVFLEQSSPLGSTSAKIPRTNMVFTITIRLPFDCNSTALRPLDDLHYDSRPAFVRAAAL